MRRGGFTFIELMVGITIFVIILIAVYGAFSMGIKTWRRGQEGRVNQRVRIAFLKMEKELRDTFFFSSIPFNGTDQEMTFPLSIPDGDIERTYIITYTIVSDRNTGLSELTRKERLFSEKTEEVVETTRNILSRILSIKFEYAYRSDFASKGLEWQGVWPGEGENRLPAGVRVALETSGSDEIYGKTIFLPHGELGIR